LTRRFAFFEIAVQLIPFGAVSLAQREQAAAILVAALAHVPSAWHDLPAAREEVSSFTADPQRMAIAAVAADDVVGWIGAICDSPNAWELHPLVVHPAFQGRGYATTLVHALEDEARRAGVWTMWLGTDDDFGGTSLFGADLYPDVLDHLRRLEPRGGHPYTFYRRLGYTVVGVLPDVDGFGRHDILMAKRIRSNAGR